MSSTAIAVPVLAERRRLHSEAGRATFSVLLFQDLAVAPILITLEILGRGHGGFQPRDLISLVPAGIGLGVIVLVGRLALRPTRQFSQPWWHGRPLSAADASVLW